MTSPRPAPGPTSCASAPRVVYVIDDLGLGGAQRQLVALLKAMRPEPPRTLVVSLSVEKTAYAPALRTLGIPLVLIAQHGKWSWRAFVRLYRTLRAARADLVHTWLFTADLYGRLAAWLLQLERRVRSRGRVCAPVIVSAVRSVEPWKPRHYVSVDRGLRHLTDAFTVNARAIAASLASRERVEAAKIVTIYNGVDLSVFDPSSANGSIRRRVGAEGATPLVGIVGRLAPEKDHRTFLQAAALIRRQVPQARFLIVGDGAMRVELEHLAATLGLGLSARFLGSEPEVAEVFAALDVAVVSSRYEGCCNVILEAMAMGKPVVATAVGGNPELVLDGVSGLLVPPSDPQAMAEAIVRLLRDRALAMALGRNGRRRVETHFTTARMAQQTAALYFRLLAGRPHGSSAAGDAVRGTPTPPAGTGAIVTGPRADVGVHRGRTRRMRGAAGAASVRMAIVLAIGIGVGYWLATRGGAPAPTKADEPARLESGSSSGAELWLSDFESEEELATRWKRRDVAVERTEAHATHGRFSAKVLFEPGTSPAFVMEDYLDNSPRRRNWSRYRTLQFDVYNADEGSQRVLVQLKDAKGQRYKEELSLPGKRTEHVTIWLSQARESLDLKRIVHVSLFRWKPKRPLTLYLDAVRLGPATHESSEEAPAAASSDAEEGEDLVDAAVTPHQLAGLWFAGHSARWRTTDPATNQPLHQIPLSVVSPGLPLSVGFPLTGGVPFPMGQLAAEHPVRLREEGGVDWPLQTRPLATWEDGSIRWLQVSTAVPPMTSQRPLWLEYGPSVSASPAPQRRVSVEQTPSRVTVTTGPLRFSVSRERFTLFESAAVDRNGDGVFSDEERLASAGDLLLKHDGREFRSSSDTTTYTLTVEESGPLRATLSAAGWFRDARGKGFGQFRVRLQAFAGLPQVRVYHTFIYTGYPANPYHHEYKDIALPDDEPIQAVSLELPVTVTQGAQVLTEDPEGLVTTPLDAPTTISQHAADGYRLSRPEATLREGAQTGGWMLIQNAQAGVMLSVRDAWQQFPKAWVADPAGRLLLHLWPEEAGPLSLATGPEAFGPDDVARGSAFGLAKTHELIVGFLGVPVPGETAQGLAALWQDPWLLAADPGWVSDTNVLGPVAPVSWERRAREEAMLANLFGWAERQPRLFDWYGMLDYGDTLLWYRREAYDKSYDEWGWHPEGRWGWHGCEALGTHAAALLGFVRTRDPSYFRFGEAKSRHVMDVDTVHYNTVANDPRLKGKIPDTFAKVGSMHRHSAYHWSGRNEEASHTHVLGLLLHYYLTGDDRAWDVANEVGSFFLQDPVTYTKHPDIAPLRTVSNVLWGDVLLHEATHDPRYRRGADRWARVLLEGQREDGTWRETYDPAGRRWTGNVKTNYITFHTLPALIAYHRLTGNDRVAQAIVKATEAMLARDRYLHALDGLAYSFQLTGQQRFLEEGRRRLQALVEEQQLSKDPKRNGMVYEKLIYDRVAPILYTVPLFLGAADAPDFPTMRHGILAPAAPAVTPPPVGPRPSAEAPDAEAPYETLVVSSLEKVLPEQGLPSTARANPASLSLARNEHEAVQLVLTTHASALTGVRVEPGELLHVQGLGRIPPEAITWSPVGFVKTKRPGYAVSHVGWWPDPLPPAAPFDVRPGRPQPIWVTVYAPPDTAPGDYTGTLTIRPLNAPATAVALRVTVWDFELPALPSLKSAFDIYPKRIESAYRQFFPQWWSRWESQPQRLTEQVEEDLIRHRLAPLVHVEPEQPGALERLRALRARGLSAFSVGRRGGSFDNNWPEDAQALSALEPEYRRAAGWLRQAGLLEGSYIYMYDEPAPGLERVAAVGRMLRGAGPLVRTLVAIGVPFEVSALREWLEPLDIIAVRNVAFDPTQAQALQRLGKEVWLYPSGPAPPYPTLVIDYPSTAYRALPWMCWKYGLSGLLYWSVTYWTTNPYEEPMNTRWQQNGNGSLYYPGREGPVGSIRLEVLRDGMEDYEYLTRLKQLVAQAQARGDADPALLEEARRLLAVEPALVGSMREYAAHPGAWESARRRLARLIAALAPPPAPGEGR